MFLRPWTSTALLVMLASCGPDYSPDTYSSNAVQQANKVEQGVIVGVRDVAVSTSGATGAVTGGAAGGIAGAQVGSGPASAFAALGGTLVGGLTGAAVEHATGDTKAFEYIVRKGNGDLVSVTQKDKVPLALGQKVLVIAGNQARVVPDYTVNLTPSEKEKERAAAEAARAAEGGKPTDAAQTPTATPPGSGQPSNAGPTAAPAASATASTPAQAASVSTASDAVSAPTAASGSVSPAAAGGPSSPAAPGASPTPAAPGASPTPAAPAASQAPGAPIRLTDPLANLTGTAQPGTSP